MLSKKAFCKYMGVLETYDMEIQHLKEEGLVGDFFDKLIEEGLDFVMNAVEDTEGWIEYYVYEENWGLNWEDWHVEINGEPIPAINTLEGLYDFLCQMYAED